MDRNHKFYFRLQNKPNEGQPNQYQYRRTFNSNTVNGPKKNPRNYRSDFNKGNRQFGDTDAPAKHQQQNYNKTSSDYSDAVRVPSEANVRTSECEPLTTLMQAPQQMYSYQDADPGNNVYGVSVGYGMYPNVNDSKYTKKSHKIFPSETIMIHGIRTLVDFSPYQVSVPMFSEPLNVESDLTQTYPYYNPHGTYYYSTPVQPFQMGQPPVSSVCSVLH